jgi:hypothetical protein
MRAGVTSRFAIAFAIAVAGGCASPSGAPPGSATGSPSAASVAGRVVDADNQPLADVTVRALKLDGGRPTTGPSTEVRPTEETTSADGSFVFDQLAPGRWRIASVVAGVQTGNAEVDVVAGERATVTVVAEGP